MWSALIFFLQFILQSCVLGDGSYECGNHGRFEYCIDEIPGCVIGCHCHPGYYFDTDTKICEPNSRLIENHRRNNVIKPSQVQKVDVTPNIIYDVEPASSTYKIEGSVDEIAKDANDLGDWLYNQFFKTIENQVINNASDKDTLTRRSGSQPPFKKPKGSKKWRKGRKSVKEKGKNKQLRRKLLRITENDSLFDISSKSSSDSSDSSSSGELSSMEYEINESNRHKHDDDEHGHKKIVMINKKPKQPLPSFIFLPNLDTPFYPPIGLPPPPIVPMYPMVPVPPVPLCPITGCIEKADNNVATTASFAPTITTTFAATTSITTSITTEPTDTDVPSSVPETTSEPVTTDANTTADVPKTDKRVLRKKNKKKTKPARLINSNRADAEQGNNNLKNFERQKILERLKEKMGSAKLFMPSSKRNKNINTEKFINQNSDADSPFLDNMIVENEFPNSERNQEPMREDTNFPSNVDFKYITQLIHRVDINNSNNLPLNEYNPLDRIELNRSPKMHKNLNVDLSIPLDIPDGRKTNRPMLQKSDESYYTNLGRQIATMIRGRDNREIQPEIETFPINKIKFDSFFNQNSPTSFWERSVRSPLTYFKTNNKKFEYLKRSNELLFDIENKVEIIASTAPSLTLQEIENIVKVMEAAKKEIQGRNKSNISNPETSDNNLNIDLWPQKKSFQNSVLPNLNKIKQGLQGRASNYKITEKNIATPKDRSPGLRMQSSENFVTWNGQNNNRNMQPKIQTYNIPTTAKSLFNNKYFNFAHPNYSLDNPNTIHHIPVKPHTQNRQPFLNQQISPYFLRNRKYFQDNDNYNLNQNLELPYFPPAIRNAVVQPSYFPERNHFDYMD